MIKTLTLSLLLNQISLNVKHAIDSQTTTWTKQRFVTDKPVSVTLSLVLLSAEHDYCNVNVALLTASSTDLRDAASRVKSRWRSGVNRVGGLLSRLLSVDGKRSLAWRCRYGRLTESDAWRPELSGRCHDRSQVGVTVGPSSSDQVNRRCQLVDVMTSQWRQRTVPRSFAAAAAALHDITTSLYRLIISETKNYAGI